MSIFYTVERNIDNILQNDFSGFHADGRKSFYCDKTDGLSYTVQSPIEIKPGLCTKSNLYLLSRN